MRVVGIVKLTKTQPGMHGRVVLSTLAEVIDHVRAKAPDQIEVSWMM
jgi:hypothetical protein